MGGPLKIDIDIDLPRKWLELYIKSRIALLKSIGYTVDKIIYKKSSSKKGYHFWIHLKEDVKDDNELNMLQFLCGDDPVRVKINMIRIKTGHREWNVLFDIVMKKYISEKCKKCRLRKYFKEMVGNNVV